MNGAGAGDLVTPRAKDLTLELAADPGFRYRVERGDALRLVGRRADGQVEVEYLQHRWVTTEDALQPLATLSGGQRPSDPAELPATGEPAAATVAPRSGPARRFALVVAVLVAAVVLVLLLMQRLSVDEEPFAGNRATPATGSGDAQTTATAPVVPGATAAPASATARATATPPVVSNLVVCDATVDCGIAAGEFSRVEILACLRVTPGGDGGPLVLVATSTDEPPMGVGSASVLARSGPVPQDPAFRCHPVRTVGGELANGRYTLWALDGTTVLGRVAFVVGSP